MKTSTAATHTLTYTEHPKPNFALTCHPPETGIPDCRIEYNQHGQPTGNTLKHCWAVHWFNTTNITEIALHGPFTKTTTWTVHPTMTDHQLTLTQTPPETG